MLTQGLVIAVIGIIVVFIILGILVLCVSAVSLLVGETTPSSVSGLPGAETSLGKNRISAVIAAAISQYRKRNKG